MLSRGEGRARRSIGGVLCRCGGLSDCTVYEIHEPFPTRNWLFGFRIQYLWWLVHLAFKIRLCINSQGYEGNFRESSSGLDKDHGFNITSWHSKDFNFMCIQTRCVDS
jgi:hypothetical protein